MPAYHDTKEANTFEPRANRHNPKTVNFAPARTRYAQGRVFHVRCEKLFRIVNRTAFKGEEYEHGATRILAGAPEEHQTER